MPVPATPVPSNSRGSVGSYDATVVNEELPPGGHFFENAARVFDTVPFWQHEILAPELVRRFSA